MSIFKKVSMTNIDKYVAPPESLSGIRCQLGVTGPQFYEARNRRGVSFKPKKGDKKDARV